MNVIFTCGGTAGHVNPALALAGLMQERDASVNILFVGSKRGMEGKLVEKRAMPFGLLRLTISAAPSRLRIFGTICTQRRWW